MFLNQLKEVNKEKFLELCFYVSMVNGEFADEEKEIIKAYCREMDIPEEIPSLNNNIDDTLEELKLNCNKVEKKIIILELIGLVECDGSYDNIEKAFMEKLIEIFGISDIEVKEIYDGLQEYLEIVKKLANILKK